MTGVMTSPARPAYLFGAVYLLEPEYAWAEVERDVRLMREHGFNYVTLWPAANAWLAKEPDEFVFTDTLRFLDLAQANGMRVLVQASGMAPDRMRPLLEGIDFAALATFDR